MKIIGFNFNKLGVEKFSDNLKNLKIDTNINIKDIKKAKQDIFKNKEEIIIVDFSFTIDYSPDIAKLDFSGNVIFSLEPKKAKEILKDWDNKKIMEDFRVIVFNLILRKANIRALNLEDELNLPPHINLPLVRKNEESAKK